MKLTSVKTLGAALLTAMTFSQVSSANAEGYIANYEAYVISVEPRDDLNMRKWPAYYSKKVAEIPHNGQYIWVQRCVIQPNGSSSDWCKVIYDGQWGWVNKSYLAAHD